MLTNAISSGTSSPQLVSHRGHGAPKSWTSRRRFRKLLFHGPSSQRYFQPFASHTGGAVSQPVLQTDRCLELPPAARYPEWHCPTLSLDISLKITAASQVRQDARGRTALPRVVPTAQSATLRTPRPNDAVGIDCTRGIGGARWAW